MQRFSIAHLIYITCAVAVVGAGIIIAWSQIADLNARMEQARLRFVELDALTDQAVKKATTDFIAELDELFLSEVDRTQKEAEYIGEWSLVSKSGTGESRVNWDGYSKHRWFINLFLPCPKTGFSQLPIVSDQLQVDITIECIRTGRDEPRIQITIGQAPRNDAFLAVLHSELKQRGVAYSVIHQDSLPDP